MDDRSDTDIWAVRDLTPVRPVLTFTAYGYEIARALIRDRTGIDCVSIKALLDKDVLDDDCVHVYLAGMGGTRQAGIMFTVKREDFHEFFTDPSPQMNERGW